MKKIKVIAILIIGLLFGSNLSAQDMETIYQKAGSIKIRDKKVDLSGTVRKDKDIFSITFNDIIKYNGHACGCGGAGFLISKEVLNKFFPNKIPNRRSVKVRISEYNMDLIDAITFITGTRLNRGEFTKKESDFIIDSSIAGKKGTTTMIFERKNDHKKLKVVIDRSKLLSKEEMMIIKTIKPKIILGTATKSERKKYAETTKAIVKKEFSNLPEGAITYEFL